MDAAYSGIAGGADVILAPRAVRYRRGVRSHPTPTSAGANFSIVVVAEGPSVEGTMALQSAEADEFGHAPSRWDQQRPRRKSNDGRGSRRVTILGHVLRGGTPTAYDRVLATRFGIEAIDAVNDGEFGIMVALHASEIIRVPIEAGVRELKTVDPNLYDVASVFFG